MQVEKQDGGIRVKRELEDGWFQHVEMPLPGAADHSIRHQQAALRHPDGHQEGQDQGDQAAHRRPTWAWPPAASSITLERIYLPERTKQTQLFDGSPKEAAAKLVEKLKFEARVI